MSKKRKIINSYDLDNEKKRIIEIMDAIKPSIECITTNFLSYTAKFGYARNFINLVLWADIYGAESRYCVLKTIIDKSDIINYIINFMRPNRNIDIFLERFKVNELISILRGFINKDEKMPKLKEYLTEMLKCKLFNLETSLSKRKIESKNIKNIEWMTITINNVNIPEEIILLVFSYIDKDKKFFDNIGAVNEQFYLLSLKSVQTWIITHKNVFSIPILVLNSIKKIIFKIPQQIYMNKLAYVYKNVKSASHIYLIKDKIFNRNYGCKSERCFFNRSNLPLVNCTKLYIYNICGCVIKRKQFPNVTNFGFVVYHIPGLSLHKELKMNNKKDLELHKETREFLTGLKKISFGRRASFENANLWYRIEMCRRLPKFFSDLDNIIELKGSLLHQTVQSREYTKYISDYMIEYYKVIPLMKNLRIIKVEGYNLYEKFLNLDLRDKEVYITFKHKYGSGLSKTVHQKYIDITKLNAKKIGIRFSIYMIRPAGIYYDLDLVIIEFFKPIEGYTMSKFNPKIRNREIECYRQHNQHHGDYFYRIYKEYVIYTKNN